MNMNEDEIKKYLKSQLTCKMKRVIEDNEMTESFLEGIEQSGEVNISDYKAIISYNREISELVSMMRIYDDIFGDKKSEEIQNNLEENIRFSESMLLKSIGILLDVANRSQTK